MLLHGDSYSDAFLRAMALQRKIELENLNDQLEVDRLKQRNLPGQDLSPDERMNLYLKKAKERKPVEDKKDMIIH